MLDKPTFPSVTAQLAQINFSRRLKCTKTHLPISFSDIGDPEGVPVLFIPPSTCSRWYAASQHQWCERHGIRLITVDRPGMGAIPKVPKSKRIELSAKMTASVLEHLDVRPRHIISVSAGIYFLLHLLIQHPKSFDVPHIYLISPWVPFSQDTRPGYMNAAMILLPTWALTAHHFIPHVQKAAKKGISAVGNAVTREGKKSENVKIPVPDGHVDGEDGKWFKQASELSEAYCDAENNGGNDHEILLCLNRWPHDASPTYISEALRYLVQTSKESRPDHKMSVDVWFGERDTLVHRQGQVWLEKQFVNSWQAFDFTSHFVPDGDHDDLLWKKEGIHEVYRLIQERHLSTQTSTDVDHEG